MKKAEKGIKTIRKVGKMKAFYTKNNTPLLPFQYHALYTAFGTHPLFSSDVAKHIVEYTLYDPKEHTESHPSVEVIRYLHKIGTLDLLVALGCASENGHLEVVKYLVEQGANIHAYAAFALRWAFRNGHIEIVKYLEEQGAN